MELTAAQKANLDKFRSDLPRLLGDKLFAGKFVVVHGEQIQHTSDTFEAALKYAVDHYPMNEFVVQQVIDESAPISFLNCAI